MFGRDQDLGGQDDAEMAAVADRTANRRSAFRATKQKCRYQAISEVIQCQGIVHEQNTRPL